MAFLVGDRGRARVSGLALGIAALLALGESSARASGPEVFGFGTRSPALAGTGTATSDDYEATYTNPAGLVHAPARRLVLGYIHADYHLRLDGAQHPVDATNGLLLGAELPLPLGGFLAKRLALGLGFYLPSGVINRAQTPYPDVSTLALLEARTQTVSVMAAGSVRLPWGLSIGGGVLALAALVGTIHLDGSAGGHISTRSEEQLVTNFAPIVGARWDRGRGRVGVVFRGESKSEYDIQIISNLGKAIPLTLPVLHITGTNQYDPMQFAVEGAVGAGSGFLLALNLTYERWSAYPAPTHAATSMTPAPPNPDFHDIVIPRAAVEWRYSRRLLDLTLRGGYFFAWSPAPTGPAPALSDGSPAPPRTQLDAHRHVLTTGLELDWRNPRVPLFIAGFFQYHQLQSSDRASGYFIVGGATLGLQL